MSMRAGCKCSMLNNQLGRGCADSGCRPLYQINEECPIHAGRSRITGDFAITGRGILDENSGSNVGTSSNTQDEFNRVRQPNEDSAI